jgi:hypothetical protein
MSALLRVPADATLANITTEYSRAGLEKKMKADKTLRRIAAMRRKDPQSVAEYVAVLPPDHSCSVTSGQAHDSRNRYRICQELRLP